MGIQFEELSLDEEDALTKIMKDFDTSNDCQLDIHEFVEGISRWLNRAKFCGAASSMKNLGTMKYLDFVHHVSCPIRFFSCQRILWDFDALLVNYFAANKNGASAVENGGSKR